MSFEFLFYLACFLYLYFHLFTFPATPIYYEQDHVNLLNDAKRLIEGEFIYRDFFEFLFPGAAATYAALFFLFGPNYWVLNSVIIAHGLIAAFLGVRISRRLFVSSYAAYLPSALFIFFGFRWFGIDGEHRMLSPLFIYLAIFLLLPARTYGRVAAAGASCALSTFFTQQRGVLAAAGITIALMAEFGFANRDWSRFLRSFVILSGVIAATLAVALLPFILVAGPDRFFQDTILFLFAYARDPETNSLWTFVHTITKVSSQGLIYTFISICYTLLVPGVYFAALLALYLRKRKGSEINWQVFTICFAGLLSVGTTGPNVIRLYQVSLPALIVLVWLLCKAGLLKEWVNVVLIASLALAGAFLAYRLQTAWDARVLDTASGRLVFLSPVIAERYEWLLQNAKPGDLVYETYNSHVNFPLGLKNPSRMSILLNTGYSPPEHVRWAIEDLKTRKPKYIIWDGAWTNEMAQIADGKRLKPLFLFLTANYELRARFTPYDGREREVWALRP